MVLSESDLAALKAMRSSLWYGGMQGLAAGFLGGVVGYNIAQRLEFVKSRIKLQPKHRFATPLFTGVIGSLLGSLTAARNHAHTLHYIIHKNSSPQLTEYEEKRRNAIQNCVDGMDWETYSKQRTIKAEDKSDSSSWAEVIQNELAGK